MKVLHLIDSGGLYGAEKMLLTLVAEQVKQGLEPMILSAGELNIDEKPLEAEARRLGLPVTPWRMKPGLNLPEAFRIVKWANTQGYSLFHSHGYKFNILIGLIPRRVHGARIVSTLHGYTAVHPFSKLGLYQFLDRWMLRRVDAVVVVSEQLRYRFGKGWSVEFIANGIEEKSLADGSSPPQHSGIRYLIAVGRLSEEKAYDRLIEAFAELNPTDMELVIVGEGGEREYLECLVAEKGLGKTIRFVGYSQNPTSLIRNAEALVITSISEGMPLVLLEAMREGTPVVSTPVGEIPRVLGDGKFGYLTSGCGSREIRDTLSDFLADLAFAREKAAGAREAFLKNYTSSRMAGRYADLYQRLGVC